MVLKFAIENEIPMKRISVAKCQANETAADEARNIDATPKKIFEISVFNVILDTAQQQHGKEICFAEAINERHCLA